MASAIVFPNGRIENKHLKNLCAFFDIVHIGTPWAMEPTPTMRELSGMGLLKIHRPKSPIPFSVDPSKLLNYYKNWITYSNEKDISSFAKAALMQRPEESRWEISQAVKQMAKGGQYQTASQDLYPFVVLHLYQQIHEDKEAADRALESINKIGSPLAEALGEDTQSSLDESYLGIDAVSIPFQEETLVEVLDSWCSIFGPLLTENEVAVTPDPQIFDLIVEKFEENLNKDLISASVLKTTKISLPSCESLSIQDLTLEPIVEIRKKVGEVFSKISDDTKLNRVQSVNEAIESLNNCIASYVSAGQATLDIELVNLSKLEDAEKSGFLRFFSDSLLMSLK